MANKKDHMIKLDLTNGYFHIKLDPKTQSIFGIKCQNKYFSIKALPQGLSVSPYIMQRVMNNVVATLLKNVPVKILIYLDDILLLGAPSDLEKAKTILFASSYLFNLSKCDLKPTRKLTYLGVTIDLDNKTLNLTKNFVSKVTKEFIKVRKYNLTKRYKQRLAGLLNFSIPILRLPIQMIHLAYFHHCKLYKYVNFMHS